MSPQGLSAHGTIIEIMPPGAGGVWTEIAELGDIGGGGFSRNEFDISTHNRDIDQYAIGILRRQPLTFPMFFNSAISSHQLVQTAMLESDPTKNMSYGFRLSSPDGGLLIFSGGVREMTKAFPVDGALTSTVTIRPTGQMILDGEVYGG